MLGNKHPRAMGARGRDVWPEIWHIIGPMLEGVLRRARRPGRRNIMLPLERKGSPRSATSPSPTAPSATRAASAGSSRPSPRPPGRCSASDGCRMLRDLAERASLAKNEDEAWTGAAGVLAANAADVPFAVLYALDDTGKLAHRRALCGVEPRTPRPRRRRCGSRTACGRWARAAATSRTCARGSAIWSARRGPNRCETAAVLPIKGSGRFSRVPRRRRQPPSGARRPVP
jgi:hypothetical protein